MRFALQVAYDGRGFAGWQIQPDRPTVQGTLEPAIAAVAGHATGVVCAGRTDAGVHALGQVVHFDTDARRPLTAWVRGVNAHLPDSVAVCRAWQVDDAFHARFAARARRYVYLLRVGAVRDPAWAGRAGWTHRSLDVVAMASAAQSLLGCHDFSAFRAAQCQAASPVRTLTSLRLRRRAHWLSFEFEADAFLHHMIRNIVSTLVVVGSGVRPPGWVADLLAARDRRLAAPTFAPDGLYFLGPRYEGAAMPVVVCDRSWMP